MKKKRVLLLMLVIVSLASMAQLPPISHVEVNNVRATILGNGTCFVPQQGAWYEEWQEPHFTCSTWEVPQGSGKETMFQLALWMGGLDADDSLHLDAFQYEPIGEAYWSGPLKTTDASIDLMTALKFHHVWNLTRAEINDFIAHHGQAGYAIPKDILTWPAHGSVADSKAVLKDWVSAYQNDRYYQKAPCGFKEERGKYPGNFSGGYRPGRRS